MSSPLGLVAIAILTITSLTILWGPRGRWVISALALQYIAVFILVSQMWPLSLAAVKLIAGWMAGAVLGASQQGSHVERQSLSIAGRLFRIAGGIFVLVVVFSITLTPQDWLPISQAQLAGGLILMGMGLFQLGLATRPLAVIVGLLTTLSGFEVIYAGVVTSVLVTGLLAAVSLGLALAGAYWLTPVGEEEEA